MTTADGERYWRSFRPRPTDVIIAPFAKCGTTWLQQIVHGLRTGGDMDFDDISRVVPWIETAHDLGIDLDAEQRAEPRAFKSHLAWDDVPKGCRYVVSVRDPKDAAVSMFRFMEGWFIESGSVPIDEFVRKRSLDRETGSDYWRHLASWLRRRENEDVLLLAFEHMKADLRGTVTRIADFIGVAADDSLLDVVIHQASLEFMSRHRAPFEDHMMRARAAAVAGMPLDGDSAKVRRGDVGNHSFELSQDVAGAFDRIWSETITAEFRHAAYGDLVADLVVSSAGR